MRIHIVIPARMASTRLKSKPLALINGKTMIERVVDRALGAGGHVVAAVGDAEIAQLLYNHAQFGDKLSVKITDPNLASGSDRVYRAIEDIAAADDIIVNVQGDMPFCPPDYIDLVARILRDNPQFDMTTLVAPMTDPSCESRVKVATSLRKGGYAPCLYFSRNPIPFNPQNGRYWGHIGIYAWRKKALEIFVNSEPSLLEKTEKLEQLRALDLGLRIGCTNVEDFPLSIDTQEDLDRARALFPN